MKLNKQNQITHLEKNEIFVFGANDEGKHGKGAARTAELYFGARRGLGEGLAGNSYALPTVKTLRPYRVYSLSGLIPVIERFFDCVEKNPHLTFFLTNVGCGLAGYQDSEIAPLFEKGKALNNLIFPRQWAFLYGSHW